METSFFPMALSFKVALVSTFFVIVAGTACAYVLSHGTSFWKELFDVFLTLPLILPPTVTGYILLVLFGNRGVFGRYIHEATGYSLVFTWHAAALASFVVAMPLMVKTARAAFEGVDGTLVLASRSMGYSRLLTFLTVVVPLSKKGLYAGAILSFARSLGEFGATLMLAGNIPGKTNTMPIAIYSYVSSGEWDKAWGMAAFFTVVSVVFLLVANRLTGRRRWA